LDRKARAESMERAAHMRLALTILCMAGFVVLAVRAFGKARDNIGYEKHLDTLAHKLERLAVLLHGVDMDHIEALFVNTEASQWEPFEQVFDTLDGILLGGALGNSTAHLTMLKHHDDLDESVSHVSARNGSAEFRGEGSTEFVTNRTERAEHPLDVPHLPHCLAE